MRNKILSIATVFVVWTTWLAGPVHADTLPSSASDHAAASAGASQPQEPASREEAIARLRDTAYGKDSSGAFREPSARVREAARQALLLMGDDGKPLASRPSTLAFTSQPTGAPSNANPTTIQQVDLTVSAASPIRADTLPAPASGPDPTAALARASEPQAQASPEETIARLRDTAYGKDATGAFREPSARVREAARQALVLMRDDGKPLASVPWAPVPSSQQGSPQSNAHPASNQLIDYRSDSMPNAGGAVSQFEVMGPVIDYRAGATPNAGGGVQALGQPTLDPNAHMRLAMMAVPAQPPSPVFQPPSSQPAPNTPGNQGNESNEVAEQLLASAKADNVPAGAPADRMPPDEPTLTANPETAKALSASVQSVDVQQRSDISFDPHVRGYKWGQLYADVDGAYWTPARLDMDTMISKIEPGMIDNVTVIPGPYGVRYGPGLSFIDVTLMPTPRNDCFASSLDSTFSVRSNGGQVYGRETYSGGGSDWGFRGSIGDKLGSDYRSGDGSLIPGNYHAIDEWAQLGYDIDPHQHLNFMYQRLDENGVDNPAEFFNTDYLGSYGFQAGYVNDEPTAAWSRWTATGWFNSTRFDGNTQQGYNPSFYSMQFVNESLQVQTGGGSYADGGSYQLHGNTYGHAYSSGARSEMTFGDKGFTQFRLGGDYRYLGQVITENYMIDGSGGIDPLTPDEKNFFTNMPHADMIDPGAFVEVVQPVNEIWTVSVGARLDYVRTDANAADLRTRATGGTPAFAYGGSLMGSGINPTNPADSNLSQDDILYAFYAMNKVQLDSHWTLDAGFGQSQRPPTLMERYSDGLFVSTLQSGFTHMLGDVDLRPERDWQFDAGLSATYDDLHAKARFFQAWIQDYVTYAGTNVNQPAPLDFMDARLLYFVNTRLATLTGFELSGDYNWDENLTLFGKMSFVSGWDQEINAPLTGISPLEATIGVRIHDSNHGKVWGIEPSLRMVATQDQPGTIRDPAALPGGTTTVEDPTTGFIVCNLRGYYNYSQNLSFVGGVGNLFDKNYQEHLDLRLTSPSGGGIPTAGEVLRVLEPGISPYFGLNWKF